MAASVGQDTDGDEDYTPLIPQVRVRIGVECATVPQFVERYCRFVDADRIFIATDAVEAVGSVVQFRVDLADGRAVIHGTGTVLEAHADAAGGMPRGMMLRFVALDESSARVVEAMGERRARSTPSLGVPTVDRAASWHTQSVERATIVPANPFGDVPDAAIAYFVDWSLERNGSLSLRRGPRAVAFAAVPMVAPRRRRRRLPAWLPFVVGVLTGGAAIASFVHAGRELDRALHPAASVAATPGAAAAAPIAHRSAATPAPGAPTPAPAAPTPVTPPATVDEAALAIAAEPGAAVAIDGKHVGRTPLVVNVAPGPHVVELSRPRYETARLDVQAPGRATAHLERPRATLHVTSNVADATVFVEGEAVGRVPLSAEVAGYERCRVEVRAPDGKSWRKRVYVRPPLTDLAATFAGE
jgi:hypothetical protein